MLYSRLSLYSTCLSIFLYANLFIWFSVVLIVWFSVVLFVWFLLFYLSDFLLFYLSDFLLFYLSDFLFFYLSDFMLLIFSNFLLFYFSVNWFPYLLITSLLWIDCPCLLRYWIRCSIYLIFCCPVCLFIGCHIWTWLLWIDCPCLLRYWMPGRLCGTILYIEYILSHINVLKRFTTIAINSNMSLSIQWILCRHYSSFWGYRASFWWL